MQTQKQNEVMQGLKQVKRMTEQAKGIAVNTNAKLYQNGEQLNRINDKLGDINGSLNKAENSAKQITSFWYRMKNKFKKVLGLELYESKQETQNKSLPSEQLRNDRVHQNMQVAVEKSADNDQDEILDDILNDLKQMKKHGKFLGNQIDRQTQILNKLDPQMDKAVNKLGKVNTILKKQLNK